MSDIETTSIDLPPTRPRSISTSLRRALQIRVAALEQEQAADVLEFDQLYMRSDELFIRIYERQQHLRNFREILLRGPL